MASRRGTRLLILSVLAINESLSEGTIASSRMQHAHSRILQDGVAQESIAANYGLGNVAGAEDTSCGVAELHV
jgi:hypothetical protein